LGPRRGLERFHGRTFFLYLAYSALTTVAAVVGSSPSASRSRSYAFPFGSAFSRGASGAFLKRDNIIAGGGQGRASAPRTNVRAANATCS